MGCRKPCVRPLGQCADPNLKKTLEPGSDHIKGQIKHCGHNSDKAGNRRVFSREHLINPAAAYMLSALLGLYHCLFTYFFNKGKTHICHGCAAVQAAFLFHLENDVLQRLDLILV